VERGRGDEGPSEALSLGALPCVNTALDGPTEGYGIRRIVWLRIINLIQTHTKK